jgi:hypothetical protein
MNVPELGKMLLLLGLTVACIGLAVMFWDKLPLKHIPIGRLPGDILIEKPRYTLYFPIASSILVSAVLTLLVWFFRR